MEILNSYSMIFYKMDLRIYDKYGVIDALFNLMYDCFHFITGCPNNDPMHSHVNVCMEMLKKELTELEAISKEVDLQDFATCGLLFLQSLTRLFEYPGYDICLHDVVAWYDNVKYRRVRTLRDKKESGPF